MKEIRQWATIICLAALAAALLQSMIPNGTMERMARFVIGAFVICALIFPISKTIPKLKLNWQYNSQAESQNSGFQSTVEDQIRSAAQQSIANLVTAQLNSINIKCKNVTVSMDTDENGRISINKVIVVLKKRNAADCKRASASLEKTTGLKMEVVPDE
jgi:hypothetical protein